MLGSPNDNECLNALNAIKGILTAQNKNFSDLSNHLFGGGARTSQQQEGYQQSYGRAHRQKEQSWQDKYNKFYDEQGEQQNFDHDELSQMAHLLLNKMADFKLSEWERDFVENIVERLGVKMRLSVKQTSVLVRIYKQQTGKNRP